MIEKIAVSHFKNSCGNKQDINLYYQVFGPVLGSAPVVLVNHSLTGDSEVTGERGWWKKLVGPGKTIDTNRYTVLSFNVPGNGRGEGNETLLSRYREFTLSDIARLYRIGLEHLGIDRLFALIGGSIGGALAWELAALHPDLSAHLIPIASDFKTTDWVRAQCRIQDQILQYSPVPLQDARIHAMTMYRTPQSFAKKFGRRQAISSADYEVDQWLSYHGDELERRWKLSSYRLMNHLLRTTDIAPQGDPIEVAAQIKSKIHMVCIDSDLLFPSFENREDYARLSARKSDVQLSEIVSVHGHDAFLIEYDQLQQILHPIFNPNQT